MDLQIASIFDDESPREIIDDVSMNGEEIEKIYESHQHDCPICMSIMAEPCIFPCGHLICAQCAWDIMCHKH